MIEKPDEETLKALQQKSLNIKAIAFMLASDYNQSILLLQATTQANSDFDIPKVLPFSLFNIHLSDRFFRHYLPRTIGLLDHNSLSMKGIIS